MRIRPALLLVPMLALMRASYVDSLVRTPQGWKFARRTVRGNMTLRAQPKAN